jgi:hypothetical protein
MTESNTKNTSWDLSNAGGGTALVLMYLGLIQPVPDRPHARNPA